jgi:TolA-binding protein
MRELERLGQEVRDELGEPSPEWLRRQQRDLTTALGLPARKGPVSGSFWVAVTLTTLLAVAVWMLVPLKRPVASVPAEVTLSTSSDERRVPLADGSSLLLAAETRARVATGDRVTRCTIELGRVFFDVSPQHGREFSVRAGPLEVTVVGTRFSVSRAATGVVEVAVTHGVVHVNVPNRRAPTELRAGDTLRGDGSEIFLRHPAPPDAPEERVPALDASAGVARPSAPAHDSRPPATIPSNKGTAAGDDWLRLYREHDYAAALAAARELGVDHLLESLAVQPLSELADAARLGGDGDLALRAFETLGRRFPASQRAQDALFLSGRLLASRGQTSVAQSKLEAYLARNPHGVYSVEATGRLVEIYATHGDPRAKATARDYLERAPHGPYQRFCRSVLAAP